MIRKAATADIAHCEAIARQYSDELAFVRRTSLARGVAQGELLVAEYDGQIVGFVNYHARDNGWQTIYDIAVHRDYIGQGYGRALLYAVPCPFRLKCTTDNERANRFYQQAGLTLTYVDKGRKRPLNVWQMRVLNIVVRGGNPRVVDICKQAASAYGIQERQKAYAWPFMIDVDFVKPDWSHYLETVKQWRPVQALVVDYSDPAQRATMLAQVENLKAAGVLRIVVCVKFPGAVADVPADCIIGVSLRTEGKLATGANKFAGYMPDWNELRGRKVHLLGGSPELQKQTIVQLQGKNAGIRVLSVDGNAQFGSAAKGSVWVDSRWLRKDGVKVPVYQGALDSTRNIQRELNAIGELGQLSLF